METDAVIVSDKIADAVQQQQIEFSFISVYDWLTFTDANIDTEVLILDLDLQKHTNDEGNVPTFFSNIAELRGIFSSLNENLIGYLESGGVLIALLDTRTGLVDLSDTDSHSWLDHLQAVQCQEYDQRKPIEDTSNNTDVSRFFGYVDSYNIGLHLQDGVVTEPNILARNPLNREPAAIAFDEYLDPNGLPRQMAGHVVLLPQPSSVTDLYAFLQTLHGVGRTFLERDTQDGDEDLGLVLPEEMFDEELIAKCARQFSQGHYQDAVQNAFIAVEERIRDQGGFPQDTTGVDLATDAFKPDSGPLSVGETSSEQQGIMQLYRAGFMAFRNPSSHRFLEDLDEVDAYHILCYANMLLSFLGEGPNNESEG